MTKRSMTLVSAALATLFAIFAAAPLARADIFEWEYINPANPSAGKQPSTMLVHDGADANAVPGAYLSYRNLTMAYLIGANLGPDSGGCDEFGCQYFYRSYLVDTNLNQADLTNAYLNDAVLTNASLSQADLTNANFTLATLTDANLSQANLTNASFYSATLTGANLTGAEVRGAGFDRAYWDYPYYEYFGGITVAQLYSTASYQAHDLTGISLSGNDLTGVNLAGQNLTNAHIRDGATLTGANLSQANLSNAYFDSATLDNADLSQANLTHANFGGSTLTGANLTGAEVRGAYFAGNITATQLYSTASYLAHDLTGIALVGINLSGGNLAGQNLTGANFQFATLSFANLSQANLTNAAFSGYENCDEFGCTVYGGADLTNANLSGADARGANFYLATWDGANLSNMIGPDGGIEGLNLTAGASLVVRDYENYAGVGIPIVVEQHLAMNATGTLRLMFDADPWDSTISFAPGIPVALGGTLELAFAPGVNIATQSGRTIDLFDWTGVTPTGAFTVESPYTWNLSKLYTTGEVTLISVAPLPGDYNGNGIVDAADYTVWRDRLGSATSLPNDDTPGVGADDYDRWKENYGQIAGAGSTAFDNAAVPEPSTLVLLMFAAAGWRFRRGRAA